MRNWSFVLFVLLILFTAHKVQAFHIAGAELVYSCTGNDDYTIRLKLYRDCTSPNAAPYDDPLTLYIFRGNGYVYNVYDIPGPVNTPEIIPDNWAACVGSSYDICLQEGIYELQVHLPPFVSGYNIGWTRCCRNSVITNLADPTCQGVTFLAHVPGAAEASCNSMPVFNNTPSIFLCANQTYYFDYSATDVDGDSLAYEIALPYDGSNFQGLGTGANNISSCNTTLPPTLGNGNVMGPPPYNPVTYASGYSYQNPFGAGGHVTINAATGYLEALPTALGIYVVAISVKEYRNGILLSENKRDFQFHVLACQQQGPPPTLSHNLSGLNVVGDTIIAEAGQSFCFSFDVIDPVSPSSIMITPLSVAFGGNGGFPPPYATITLSSPTPPTTGTICWAPSCSYSGSVVPMIFSARDINDCPNYNLVFDTIWVRVVPPVPAPPVVTATTGLLPANGDTIVLNVHENFCFDFTVVDTTGGGNLVGHGLLEDLSGNLLGQVQTVTTTVVGDTLFGHVCWETFCNFGRQYMFVLEGIDDNRCPPGNVNRDTVWLRVVLPNNPAPALTTDIFQNPTNGDTILANVNEGFCFLFGVQDTTNGVGESVTFDVSVFDGAGGLILDNPVTYSVFGTTDSIAGQICWTPRCANLDQLIVIYVRGDQENACNQHNYDIDTIYVRVTEPFKPKPLISHDLGPSFPGNAVIDVADDAPFCYDFVLQDTLQPTYLVYSLTVLYANGAPFTGAPPTLTYTTQNDSLLMGNVCWTVPCALSGQQFMVVMQGRDTFDCRPTNTVFDTVQVRHTENQPATVMFCNATVDDSDAAIGLTWEAAPASDIVGYVVERHSDENINYQPLDTILDPLASSYVDANGVDPDLHSYCYRIVAMDRCGLRALPSAEICTIRLEANPLDYTTDLHWSPLVGWGNGPLNYEVWRAAPLQPGYAYASQQSLPPTERSYLDISVDRAKLCYRIRANADGTGCADFSQSNEACVTFPPTLYVPTAFTPNGDGLNDIFSTFAEFIESFELSIYDRWGKLLFQTNDVSTGWDGSVDKRAAPEGNYIFRIQVKGYGGEELLREGSVMLIR